MKIKTIVSTGLMTLALVAAACTSGGNGTPSTTTPLPTPSADTTIERTAPVTTTDSTVATDVASSSTSATTDATIEQVDCAVLRAGGSTIDVDGTLRMFDTYLPDDADASGAIERPVLVLLHGFAGTAAKIARSTELDVLAPAAGVVLITPQGQGDTTTWHIGGADDSLAANDTAFLDQLLDDVAASPCADASNIWIAGFSAGSAYAGVYGCSHVERVAGIAMVSGLPPGICPEDAAVSIQITHGTADAIVPFGGGDQTVSDEASVDLNSVPASSADWAARAGCGDPVESSFGDTNPSNITAWTDCRGGATVSLLAVEGLNHVWAGSRGPDSLDEISPVVDAGCVILHTMTAAEGDAFAACFGP